MLRGVVLLVVVAGLAGLIGLVQGAQEEGRERFLLYTVNPGEGFNLARNVFIRVAALLTKLKEVSADRWTLVLPPWYRPACSHCCLISAACTVALVGNVFSNRA